MTVHPSILNTVVGGGGWIAQWRVQDLKEGGAKPIARKIKPRPQKPLTTPLINAFLKIAG